MALTECANGHLYDSAQHPTCPYCGGNMNRMEFSAAPDPGVGKTVGVAPSAPAPQPDTGKTVAVFQKSFSREPVTGWLVCIEGPDRGHDYRIRTGYNHIGRAEHMDICIRGDKQISREKHALVAYDDTEKVFFFGPSDGKNIVRVNDKMVMVPTQLHAYDTVTVGTSKLIFVPLCGENFNWNE